MGQTNSMSMMATQQSPLAVALTCVSVLVLSACGGGNNKSNSQVHDDSSSYEVDSDGRLALYNTDASTITTLDLDNGTVESAFPVQGGSPRVYASSSNRYALLVQREEGRVSFLDSGLYGEDHGDHWHEYKVDPAMSNATFVGSRPTHVTQHEGATVVFYDGEDGVVSSVQLFTDDDIAAGAPGLSFDLNNNMHGVAKPVDDKLFVTYRDPSITDTTLPASVERYVVNNGVVTMEHRYEEACPRLHGSAQNQAYLVFGCSDGLLGIDLEQSDYPAFKIANPSDLEEDNRIGSVYAHSEVGSFVGVAGDQFFVIDPTGTESPMQLMLADGESRLDQGFTHDGAWFYVLADSGVLHLFDASQEFAAATFDVFDGGYPETTAGRQVTQSGSGEWLYILDPAGTAIVEVSVENRAITERFELGFAASYPTWLGLGDSD